MATTASIIGALAAVAGTGYGIYSSEKAQDQQKKALKKASRVSDLQDLSPTNDILKELLGYTPQRSITWGKQTYAPDQWNYLLQKARNPQEKAWVQQMIDAEQQAGASPYGSIGYLTSGVGGTSGGPTKLGAAMNTWNDPLGILGKPNSVANWVLNPVGTAIGAIFGGHKKKKPRNPMVSGTTMAKTSRGVFEDPRFTPDEMLTPLQQTVRDYIYGETQNRFQNDYPYQLGDKAMQAYLNPSSGPYGPAIDLVAEAMKTGLVPDLDAIRKEAMRLYREEDLPGIKEQFAPQTRTFSSDFLNAAERELGAIESRLGALAAEYQDKGSSRKMQAAGMYPDLVKSNVQLPLATADDLLKLGTNLENLGPAVRILDQLGYLSNLGTQQRFVQPGYSPQSGDANSSSLAALATTLPALAKAGSDLFSSFGPSGGGSTITNVNLGTGFNPTAGANYLNSGTGLSSLYQPTMSTNLLSNTGNYPVQLWGGARGF